MILPPRRITSLCIVGQTLHAARVTIGPFGARVGQTAVVDRFLSLSQKEAADSLRRLGAARRIVLTVPATWCAIRPIALTTRAWPKARQGVVESIDRLLPISPSDALVGLLNVYNDQLSPTEGRLIAIRRQAIGPWLAAVKGALDRHVGVILSPEMAMLGLGGQARDTMEIVDTSVAGDRLVHTLARGLAVSIAEPTDDEAAASALTLPDGAGNNADVSGVELAIAAALASFVAPGAFAPLLGPTPSRRIEWVAPVAAALLAASLMISAPMIGQSRLRAGVDRLRTRRLAMQDRFNQVRTLREDAERLARLLDETTSVTDEWRSVLPVIAEVQAALPDDGFLYRIVVDEQSVTISGEASDAPAVLQRMEASPLLASARRTGVLFPSTEPGLDIFEMRAQRRDREGDR